MSPPKFGQNGFSELGKGTDVQRCRECLYAIELGDFAVVDWISSYEFRQKTFVWRLDPFEGNLV